MAIFLGNFNKISDTQWQVMLEHNRPELLNEETLATGILIDSMPDKIIPLGKALGSTYINPVTKEVWYDYVDATDAPLPPEEQILQLKAENESLKQSMQSVNADLQAFMDFYFTNNPV